MSDSRSEAAPKTGTMTGKILWRRLGPAGPLAIVSASLPLTGAAILAGTLLWLAPWLHAHRTAGVIAAYAVCFAVTSGLAILPTQIQSGLGGWSFGFAYGAPAAVAGAWGGIVIGYLVARRASGDHVVVLIHEHPKWKAIYDTLVGSGFWKALGIVTLLRLPPSSPFAITNLVMAATRVPLGAYLLGSFVGVAPRTIAVVYIAAGLHELDFRRLGQSWLTVAGIVATAVTVIVIGIMANRAITRFSASQDSSAASQSIPQG